MWVLFINIEIETDIEKQWTLTLLTYIKYIEVIASQYQCIFTRHELRCVNVNAALYSGAGKPLFEQRARRQPHLQSWSERCVAISLRLCPSRCSMCFYLHYLLSEWINTYSCMAPICSPGLPLWIIMTCFLCQANTAITASAVYSLCRMYDDGEKVR